MQRPSTAETVYKLAIAGEQAGFTLEQMIQILNAGVSVETLLNWIEWRLGQLAARGSPGESLAFSSSASQPMLRRTNNDCLHSVGA
jgi:hypothetical protein